MQELCIRVRYLLDTKDQREFWLKITPENGEFTIQIMLVKNKLLELDATAGFNHINHPLKFKVNLKQTKEKGVFKVEEVDFEFNQMTYALCTLCCITAWETWNTVEFCGFDYSEKTSQQRLAWFGSDDLDAVLAATEVLKIV